MQKKIAFLLVFLILASTGTVFAQNEKSVVTSFYPLYVFTSNLLSGVEGVTVTNLAAPEVGCLHDYQLSTTDMKLLSKANVFVVNGAGMEHFLSEVATQFESLKQVVATDGITLIDQGNAHVWLSVHGAIAMVNNIEKDLCLQFEEHAEAISRNAEAYRLKLTALDETLKEGLAPFSGKEIVTFHEAFPYFAKAYGLTVAHVIDREPGEALSPAELAKLTNDIKALNNPPLFIEPQYPDIAAQTLSVETGAKVYMLDPMVTGPVDEAALSYYETTMLFNMAQLIQAFSE